MNNATRQPNAYSLCLVLSLLVLVLPVFGQTGVSTGSIMGFISDPTGTTVPNVEVVLGSDTGYKRTVRSGDDGSYRALVLPPGIYRVSASRSGFKTIVREGLNLSVDENLRLDLALEVGDTAVQVTVQGDSLQVDTHSSESSSVVTKAQLDGLPIGGSRFLAAVGTAPGVIPADQKVGVITNPYVGWLFGYDSQGAGAQNNGTDYQVDSSSTRQGIWGGSPILPTSVSIAEVKVIRNQFSAEYGVGAVMVVNAVTKSGNNLYHGQAFEILGNDKFNSRLFNSPSAKPPLRYNQFGGDIGGPVRIPGLYDGRNKTFFYFDYEGLRLPTSTLIQGGLPPTAAQKAGDFSAVSGTIIDPTTRLPFPGNKIPTDRLSPVAQYLTAKMPLANFGDQYRDNFSTPSSAYEYAIRVDQNIGSRDRLFGRWWRSIPKADTVGGTVIVLPEAEYESSARNRALTLNNTYTFTSSLVNQTTFAHNNIEQLRDSKAGTEFVDFQKLGINGWNPDGSRQTAPAFNIPASNLSINTVTPSQMYDSNYLFSNTLLWIKGNHSLKFGFEFGLWRGRYSLGPGGNGQSNGVFTFGGSFTGNGLADFVLGLPDNLNKTSLLPIPLSSKKYAGFVQDDFRLTRRLTLNLGLRYRVDGPYVHEKRYGTVFIQGQQSTVIPSAPLGMNFVGDKGVPDTLYPTDWNDWAPRIGFAYDPMGTGRTAIRGGYGIYYVPTTWAPAYFAAQQQPYGQVVNMVPASLADPFAGIKNPYPYKFDPGNATFNLPVSLSPAISNDIRSATLQSWSFGLQHQVNQILMEATYVGSRGRNLMSTGHINAAKYIPGTDSSGAPLSTLQNLNSRRSIEPSPGTYGAIVLNDDFGYSDYHALQTSARGRLASNLLVTGAWTWGHSLDVLTWGRSVDTFDSSDPFNVHNNRGNSDFDYRHIVTASAVFDSPKLTSMPIAVRALFGNWQSSLLFNTRTGQWLTVYSGQDRSLSGVGSDRADVLLPSSQFVNPAATTRGEQYLAYINKAAFAPNAIGTFGNAGRNTVNMPGGWTADASIQRRFPVREVMSVNFRADFYNAFNHTRLGSGVYWGAGTLLPVNSPSFGALLRSRSGRVIQFRLAISF
ncbi:MAG: carboxypeptidase regulatory-like domain-containing protein [Bryobacteraceae bacterium]